MSKHINGATVPSYELEDLGHIILNVALPGGNVDIRVRANDLDDVATELRQTRALVGDVILEDPEIGHTTMLIPAHRIITLVVRP